MINLQKLNYQCDSLTLAAEVDKRERLISRLWNRVQHEELLRDLIAERISISWMIKQRGHYLRLTQNTLESYGLHTA